MTLAVTPTRLPEVLIVEPKVFGDERGFFLESFNQAAFESATGVSLPFVEVHVTNVHAREPERRHSMLAPAAIGSVVGLGTHGYELALRGLVAVLRARAAARG